MTKCWYNKYTLWLKRVDIWPSLWHAFFLNMKFHVLSHYNVLISTTFLERLPPDFDMWLWRLVQLATEALVKSDTDVEWEGLGVRFSISNPDRLCLQEHFSVHRESCWNTIKPYSVVPVKGNYNATFTKTL